MNTNLILVTNIPKHVKHYDLLKEVENKWSRLILIENPYAELFDAFIYNPTPLISHFEMGISRLRNKVINGSRPLKVYHVWFPPPNVHLANLIPDNSSMLPFLFVDNLPKDCDTFAIIGDLPFQTTEVKHWDIPQKEDKWMILRLPINQDEAIRDYVLKYIRSRRLHNGLFPRVLEVFVSEDAKLSKSMIPKSVDILPITSYKSNLLFLYDLPTKLTVKGISDASKSLGVRGSKAFFIDVVDSLRVGFLFIPRSFPEHKFDSFQELLSEKEIITENNQAVMLNLNEVYLQPKGAVPPRIFKKRDDDDRTVEYILTYYLYVHNVPVGIDHNQLIKGSPINFKIYLFQISDNMLQVGFICLRGLSEIAIIQLTDHLRSLMFEGFSVMVDNVYLRCYDLPENLSERRTVHLPRKLIENADCNLKDDPLTDVINDESSYVEIDIEDEEEENVEEIEEKEDITSEEVSLEIGKEPPPSYNLMKSDFIFVNYLSNTVDGSVFSFLSIDEDAFTFMSCGDHKIAFLYYPEKTTDEWMNALDQIMSMKSIGRKMEVSEVYLQSDESVELLKKKLNMIKPSNYVFVYNISDCKDLKKLEGNPNIVQFSTIIQDSGSCAFVELASSLSVMETIEALNYIRDIRNGKTNLCADLIWFGEVRNKVDPNAIRSRWLKKSEPIQKRIKLNNSH